MNLRSMMSERVEPLGPPLRKEEKPAPSKYEEFERGDKTTRLIEREYMQDLASAPVQKWVNYAYAEPVMTTKSGDATSQLPTLDALRAASLAAMARNKEQWLLERYCTGAPERIEDFLASERAAWIAKFDAMV